MQDLLLEEYRAFTSDLHSLTFLALQHKFSQHQDPLLQLVGSYLPRLHHYEPAIDQHTREEPSLRRAPSFNHKQQFDNTDNLHRAVIDTFKGFVHS